MNKPAMSFTVARDIRARFTAAEFARMIGTGAFADMTVELVGGELERMPPPGSRHANWQIKIGVRLSAAFAENRLLGEVGIVIDDETVLACDVAVLREPVADNRLLRAADLLLVVEVAETTLARDTGMKRLLYAGAGVAHYWVVDDERAVVHLYRDPVAGDYADARTVRFGAPIPVPGTEGEIVIE